VRISIIGTGYVGLVSGTCLADRGHQVTCVDLDPAKVAMIANGQAPIHEVDLPELLTRHAGRNLKSTTDLRSAVLDSDLTLIAVGTPYRGEQIDLSQIRSAATAIGQALREKDGYHAVIVKSTVVPGTTRDVVMPLLEEASGKQAGTDFGVGMNPEFLREGNAVADFMHPDRIILGGIDDRTRNCLAEVYASFQGVDLVRTTTETAEMTKYAANALLATLISFSNEIGNLCETVGTDVTEVLNGVHLDRRVSPLLADGTRIRPGLLEYLAAGCGYGGSCFPKDVRALVAHGRKVGEGMHLLQSVTEINDRQPSRIVGLVREELAGQGRTIAGARVAVLGIAFKPGTDDTRESPSIPLIESLLDEGAVITAFDPIARIDELRVQVCSSRHEAIRDAEVIVVMTRWPEFAELAQDLAARTSPGSAPLVVDARRFLRAADFAWYTGVGYGKAA
jgi:UDPglucose 6-dehydrogenase